MPLNIETVKDKINELVGKNITMSVCRGRKQVKKYTGVVSKTYPRVFTVQVLDDFLTYSYSDVVCGEVCIFPA